MPCEDAGSLKTRTVIYIWQRRPGRCQNNCVFITSVQSDSALSTYLRPASSRVGGVSDASRTPLSTMAPECGLAASTGVTQSESRLVTTGTGGPSLISTMQGNTRPRSGNSSHRRDNFFFSLRGTLSPGRATFDDFEDESGTLFSLWLLSVKGKTSLVVTYPLGAPAHTSSFLLVR